MNLTDRDDLYKNYNHPDNWMSSEDAEDYVNREAAEKEEQEWEEKQRRLDEHYRNA